MPDKVRPLMTTVLFWPTFLLAMVPVVCPEGGTAMVTSSPVTMSVLFGVRVTLLGTVTETVRVAS